MNKRMILLDRDGTLMEDVKYAKYVHQVHLFPDVLPGLRELGRLGFGLAVVTNQSGIGRGLITDAQARKIHRRLTDIFQANHIAVSTFYYCPHTPDQGCDCRKPQPGLLNRALSDYQASPGESYMVGDEWTDVQAGVAAGVNPVLLRRSNRTRSEDQDQMQRRYSHHHDPNSVLVVSSFEELAILLTCGERK